MSSDGENVSLDKGGPERGQWSSSRDLFFTIVSWSVGLGNVWRFPYLCFRNGGGAFLIPYLTSLALVGIPLFYMEMAIGQYSSLGATSVWGLSPIFKGIGIAAIILIGIIDTYYNVIIAYILYYLYASMTKILPWTSCGNEWNTPACTLSTLTVNSSYNSSSPRNVNITSSEMLTYEAVTKMPSNINVTDYNTSMVMQPKSAAEEYFQNHVLGQSSGIDNMGYVQGHLVVCLFISWVLVFFTIIKGVKSMGKVVYFTALFPYAILTALLIRGLTLPGSLEGIKFFLIPVWSKLATSRVWGDGAAQIFFSLGPCWGPIITFGSYNKFHFNFHLFSVVSSMVCVGSSLFAGFCIFSVIGFMAHELQVPIQDVVASGPGLAFVVYPEALSRMPIAPLWSVLFFCMLLLLGIGSSFSNLQSLMAALFDEYESTLGKTWPRRILATLVACILYFVAGIPICAQGGIYLLNLIDGSIGTFTVMIIGFMEAVAISYVFGINNFSDIVEIMLGRRPDVFLKACLCFFAPVISLLVLILNACNYKSVTHNSYVYPGWAQALGWFIIIGNIMVIPIWVILGVTRHGGQHKGWYEKLSRLWNPGYWRGAVRPSSAWAPVQVEDRLCAAEFFKMKQKQPCWTHEMEPLNKEDISAPEKNLQLKDYNV